MTRRFLGVVLAAFLAAGVAACGESDGAEGEPVAPSTADADATSTVPDGELPPPAALDLEPIYGDALAAIGMRLTDRGGTIDRSGGGYVASPEGTHLALYVEPIDDDRTTQEYIDGILDVAVVFSDVYDRWPGLETYDVCQEPADPEATLGPEPLPVTQIELTRAESVAIDWETVTVEDLVRGSMADPPELALRVSAELAADPAYQAIAGDGGEGSGSRSDGYSR